jgi:hypothetical protein
MLALDHSNVVAGVTTDSLQLFRQGFEVRAVERRPLLPGERSVTTHAKVPESPGCFFLPAAIHG